MELAIIKLMQALEVIPAEVAKYMEESVNQRGNNPMMPNGMNDPNLANGMLPPEMLQAPMGNPGSMPGSNPMELLQMQQMQQMQQMLIQQQQQKAP